MALSDGDLFVSGSILSYQQANRIYQNFRGATVPSALQAGALWSDSDDNRLWHQGTTLDEVFTEKTTLTWENLLSNSGFGVWSQSDASKGLATITYDQGAKGAGAAPSVGDAGVGGTSGATCKLISYTILTGAFATNDATGVLTVGACSHDFAFVDNETITFGGVETVVVNMPDSAVQVGLVQNGGFATDTDPPDGWTAGTGATLTTEGAGQVGNCLMVLCDGSANRIAYQAFVTVVGKIYKCSVYFKKGTGATGQIKVGENVTQDQYYNSGAISDAAWTKFSATFEAATTSTTITLYSNTAASTAYFDEVTAYEITPCCTGADFIAFDGWNKDSTCDIYRQHNDDGTLTKDGSFYSLKIVPGAAADWIEWGQAFETKEERMQEFAGRTITLGAWVKTSTASHCRIRIYDGTNYYSSYHTGGGAWEWLEVSVTIQASPSAIYFMFNFVVAPAVAGTTIVYISQPMLVFGSHIGEGNYQPKQGEIVWLEKYIASNLLNGLISQSDIAWADLNIEADSDGMLPKGCKAVQWYSQIRDSGTAAATACYIALRRNATKVIGSYNNIAGLADSAYKRANLWQDCDETGDLQYRIEATGAGTFDVNGFNYFGVQVN